MNEVQLLNLADHKLAYQQTRGANFEKKTGVVFLCGYASDMSGTKACFLAERCKQAEIPFLRFDYRGCGLSEGVFLDGTIGAWLEDTLAVFDQLTHGPQIVIGSSMGGWLALLLAMKRRDKVNGIIGVAAAPDFTEELIWKKLPDEVKEKVKKTGFFTEGTGENELAFTLSLIDEARSHLIMDKDIDLTCPCHFLQGMNDTEVPWEYPAIMAKKIVGKDVSVTLVKDADHRFSRDEDLRLLWTTLENMISHQPIPD